MTAREHTVGVSCTWETFEKEHPKRCLILREMPRAKEKEQIQTLSCVCQSVHLLECQDFLLPNLTCLSCPQILWTECYFIKMSVSI